MTSHILLSLSLDLVLFIPCHTLSLTHTHTHTHTHSIPDGTEQKSEMGYGGYDQRPLFVPPDLTGQEFKL